MLSATYSPDGKRVLTASGDKTAQIWDRASGKSLTTLKGHEWAVLCGQFAADGQRIITGSQDATARIWDARTGEARSDAPDNYPVRIGVRSENKASDHDVVPRINKTARANIR